MSCSDQLPRPLSLDAPVLTTVTAAPPRLLGGFGVLTRQVGGHWVIEVDANVLPPATGVQPVSSVSALAGGGAHDETPMTGGWVSEPASGVGVMLTVQTATVYAPSGDRVLYAFERDLTFDAGGRLLSVSEERRVTIALTEACA